MCHGLGTINIGNKRGPKASTTQHQCKDPRIDSPTEKKQITKQPQVSSKGQSPNQPI